MNLILRKTALVGVAVFLLMQLYQPTRNVDYGQVLPIHFVKMYNVPSNVKNSLQTTCFDCHSNNSTYPWYSYIQPVRMFMESHINEGKKNLNFSEFGSYSSRKQASKLERMIKEIQSGEMPLTSYTVLHRNAILSPVNKQVLVGWLEKMSDTISSNN
jgi:hypothetical protein